MSSGGDAQSLFLEDAAWIGADGSLTEIDNDGLLITSGIQWVQFVRTDEHPSQSGKGNEEDNRVTPTDP